jgi:hypothetical protein
MVHNSLTDSLVPFVPATGGRRVLWYTCGPTVYDSCHMGHARAYLTFDILRRIMEDYFRCLLLSPPPPPPPPTAYRLSPPSLPSPLALRRRCPAPSAWYRCIASSSPVGAGRPRGAAGSPGWFRPLARQG